MKASKALRMLMFMVAMSGAVHAQNIDQIRDADPLVITGAVGTQNTYHYSSGTRYASPLNNTIYANLNISIYGFTMPFSLYYTNNNLDFNYPQISFNLTPSYKSWTGHIGESSIAMSNYVMNMSFYGIGLEYNDGKRWRGGIFYGRLRKAINDDPTDPFARSPQYSRMGWGFKAGYGSGKNYLDLYMLYAYDKENSLDERWCNRVSPQDNVVVGLKGCVTPFSWMSFTANAATSVFSTDTRAEKVAIQTDFDKVFDVRYSTLMRFAGDANMNLMFKGFNTSLSYRFIQPDYTTLGTYYMSNNYHSLGVTTSGTLFRKLSLSATFNGQADNLTNEQMYTTRGFIYSANASMRLGNHLSLSAGYNGYQQSQGDGVCQINETIEVRRVMNSLNFTPSYTYDTEQLGHNVSLSASYTENKDLNRFATGESDVKTMALGASYGMDIHAWEVNVGASLSHQQSNGYHTRYTSDVGSITLSRSFLEEKNLSVSLTGLMAYNEVRRQSKNLSMGGSFSVGYTLARVHVFSASGSFNKYGDVNITKTRSNLDMTDISLSLNYAYTFSLLTIKSKKHRQQETEQKEREMREKVEKALKE
ncbi:MAG: hypothetical protein IJT48_06155 [Bacteroidaceae bacterium]|nr:hypothetical protein [Bacteroidaceae bacterium]